ncbi:SmpA / OmlA family protein [Oceanospirillum linum]|nr:SmpA / OmlA family protein [Oleiphilus messinensis]SMP32163.1 SmpA / OmlA family protein [Oceanospirillum linum]
MTDEMINQLQPGLTREQVVYVMGNPLTPSTINPNRWDYIYWSKDPRDNVTQQKVSLVFDNNRLVEINKTP